MCVVWLIGFLLVFFGFLLVLKIYFFGNVFRGTFSEILVPFFIFL